MKPQQINDQLGNELVLKAPLSGLVVPLEQVPDPVFAQKMVGDGVAIDPISDCVYAPCDGEISQIHESKHAVRIKTEQGPEILIHVGLDTVMLRGDGFTPHVNEGDKVTTGQKLLEFNADSIATKARSLMTEIIITNSDNFGSISQCPTSTDATSVDAGTHDLIRISLNAQPSAEKADFSAAEWIVAAPITLKNPQGIHARPAAVLSKTIKTFSADVELRIEDRHSDARSIVGLMGLNSHKGDTVIVAARGDEADKAIEAAVKAIQSGLGEEVCSEEVVEAVEVFEEAPLLNLFQNDQVDIQGIAAAPGTAVGEIYLLAEPKFEFAEKSADSAKEQARLQQALSEVASALGKLAKSDNAEAEIFAAHLEMLSDPVLAEDALTQIEQGLSAEQSWHQATMTQVEVLSKLNNPLLEQRATDLQDLRVRMLSVLTKTPVGLENVPPGAILAVDDLTPSMTANLSAEKISGVITRVGGATSHAAILARAAGFPYVAGINHDFEKLSQKLKVILDGTSGAIELEPDEAALALAEQKKAQARAKQQKALDEKTKDAVTTDGKQIEVVANIANEKDALDSVEFGGEGVGLLRSEFLFQSRLSSPTEDEQFETYSAIQKALAGRPLIIRTLDVGGDKPLAYLPLPQEENPFLGERGIRVGLNRPGILRPQVRAILRANAQADGKDYGAIRIMFPMVSIVEEVRVARQVVMEEAADLGVPACEIGIMVEVPSTAAMARQFAKEVDFFSIGSNDLSQYTMAIDRGHPKLAAQADGLNPGILQLIKMTVEGAHAEGKWVGVCGGIASEPEAVPVLLGLGVDELSVSIPQIPEVKAQVRQLSLSECQTLSEKALAVESAAQVRALTQQLTEF